LNNFETWMGDTQARIEAALAQHLPAASSIPHRLHQAMRYSVLGGGKRIRPLLTFAAGELTDAVPERLAVAACAVELIHTYSLVHDDLPCMDDDVLRRGRPTCHVEFDEATALLAGDALQTLAFELLARPDLAEPAQQLEMLALLTHASGSRGMCGGQAIDLAAVGQALSQAELELMHALKTGTLIRAAVLLGALCGAPLPDEAREQLDRFAKRAGLLFQVVDDILDCTASTATLGKTAGKDEAADKPTYVSLLGLEGARTYAEELRSDALSALASFGPGPTADPTGGLHLPSTLLTMTANQLLDQIQFPADLRRLERGQLPQLADELRQFLLGSVARTGGHLSSNLGTVELTLALHYVYNTPEDRLVWDVGHQCYAHKVLTGRREGMARLRMQGGVSGFPKRSESEYDTFGVGHSSTSISAALGMAMAAKLKAEDRKVVAIIGDGAMSAGMAFEALNNAGVADADMLVILNDNEMSISPPVGALNSILTRLTSSKTYNAAREAGRHMLGFAPPLLELARRAEEHVKGMISPGTLFEEFGFHYYGPIDGHDLDALVPTLENIKKLKGPQFLHVITKKGQGYKLAEADPILYHGVGKFDTAEGIQSSKGGKLTYTQVFGDWLCDMAAADPRLVAITPAMGEGSGMVRFAGQFPERYFDVGIAEQHAITFAAGLACEGLKPVVAIYSTFLQRGYDQLIHDVALQNLPVLFAIDRGGLVGADGATHHGSFDLSFLTCIPNMVVMAPADEAECRRMLSTAYALDGPAAVRYPRGSAPAPCPTSAWTPCRSAKANCCGPARTWPCWLLAAGWPRPWRPGKNWMPRSPTCASSSPSTPNWWSNWHGTIRCWSASKKMP